MDLPCRTGLSSDKLSTARILNLSMGGLKFSCGRDAFQSMVPADQRTPGRVIDVIIELDFELQLPGEPPAVIHTLARIIHSERLSQDEFHMGVQFTGMEEAAVRVLRAYVEEHLSTQV